LGTNERNRFEQLAMRDRAGGEKYTSLGVPISVQEKYEQDKKDIQMAIKHEIISLVESLSGNDEGKFLSNGEF
jgi:hypothetical protein